MFGGMSSSFKAEEFGNLLASKTRLRRFVPKRNARRILWIDVRDSHKQSLRQSSRNSRKSSSHGPNNSTDQKRRNSIERTATPYFVFSVAAGSMKFRRAWWRTSN